MRRLLIFVRFMAVGILLCQCGSMAFAQDERTDLREYQEASRSGLTGAGTGDRAQRPQNPEKRTAWETPYSEGSAVRSTGYDPATWWRSHSPSLQNLIRP